MSCLWKLPFLAVVLALSLSDAQQSWFKPVSGLVTTGRPPISATRTTETTTIKAARKSSAVIFPFTEEEAINSSSRANQQQIPLSLLYELNEADDWSDFLKFVDNVTVVEDGDHQPYFLGSWEDIDARTGGAARAPSIPAKAANCQPELQTVRLVTDVDPTVLYYPTCTRIERCGGCCSSDLLACEPTRTETVLMQVIKTQYSGGTRMKYAGKENIPVEKHLACKCQCKIKERHCTSNQVYVPGACRCECANLDDRRKCEAENQTRYWDSRNCMCRCRDNEISQCSTGYFFNEDVCRCEPWVLRRREDAVDRMVIGGEGGRPSLTIVDTSNSEVKSNLPANVLQPSVSVVRPVMTKVKDEDHQEDDNKKNRPIERFQFAYSWDMPKNKRPNV